MVVTKLQLTRFIPKLTSDGNEYTKEFNLFYTGVWDAMLIGTAITAPQGETPTPTLTLPILGEALGTGDYASYFSFYIEPTVADPMAGFATVKVDYKALPDMTPEYLSGAKDILSISDVQQTREVVFDFNGKALVNTANQLFAANAQVPFNLRQITIQGIRSNIMYGPYSQWKIVNGSSIGIGGVTYAAGTLWLTGTTVNQIVVNGVKKYQHQWNLLAKADKHDLEIPNVGTVQLKDGKIQPIFIDSVKITQPWPLTSAGAAVAKPTSGADAAYAQSIYDNRIKFDITEDFSFSSFNWNF